MVTSVKLLSYCKVLFTYILSWHFNLITRSSSVLPSLDATISYHIKKAIVGMTQLTTALVSIHSSMTFLTDMYSFLDPPGRTVLFFVDDCSLFPVDWWLLVKAHLVLIQLPFYVHIALCLTFFQFLHMSCHSWHKEPYIHILLCLSYFVCDSLTPVIPSMFSKVSWPQVYYVSS